MLGPCFPSAPVPITDYIHVTFIPIGSLPLSRFMMSGTVSYWQSSWHWSFADTCWRGLNNPLWFGPTTRTSLTFNLQNGWVPARPGGHCSTTDSSSQSPTVLGPGTTRLMPSLSSFHQSTVHQHQVPSCQRSEWWGCSIRRWRRL